MSLDFAPSEEQAAIRDAVREMAQREIAPRAALHDRTGEFPAAAVAHCAEMGLCGMAVPEEWGGSGLDAVTYVLVLEEVARACASTAVTLAVTNSVCAQPIHRFGSDEQRRRWLRPLAEGKILGGFMLSEPGSGSDAKAMQTKAVRRGDDWVLDGAKAWVTNGGVAAVFIVFARTGDGPRDVTAFLVEADRQGLDLVRHEDKLGLRASQTAAYALAGLRVPAGSVLGEVDGGLKVALGSLDRGRLGIAAQAMGIGGAAFAAAVAQARDRQAFGGPIARFQAIQWMLADVHVRMEAARGLLMRAAWLSDRGRLTSAVAAMAKVACTEAASFACDRAVQVHGGMGYSRESLVERAYRDVRVTTIYEGTSEIQRLVIARGILG